MDLKLWCMKGSNRLLPVDSPVKSRVRSKNTHDSGRLPLKLVARGVSATRESLLNAYYTIGKGRLTSPNCMAHSRFKSR